MSFFYWFNFRIFGKQSCVVQEPDLNHIITTIEKKKMTSLEVDPLYFYTRQSYIASNYFCVDDVPELHLALFGDISLQENGSVYMQR